MLGVAGVLGQPLELYSAFYNGLRISTFLTSTPFSNALTFS